MLIGSESLMQAEVFRTSHLEVEREAAANGEKENKKFTRPLS